MDLDYGQNYVSAQYFENKLMEIDRIMHVHLCWPALD